MMASWDWDTPNIHIYIYINIYICILFTNIKSSVCMYACMHECMYKSYKRWKVRTTEINILWQKGHEGKRGTRLTAAWFNSFQMFHACVNTLHFIAWSLRSHDRSITAWVGLPREHYKSGYLVKDISIIIMHMYIYIHMWYLTPLKHGSASFTQWGLYADLEETHTHGHSTGVGKKSVDFNLCISEVVTISDEENAVRIHSIFFVVTTTQFRWGHEVW